MTGWAIEALVASAALLALVLAIRGPVRRAFGPGVAYALWALPALRLVLPPLPAGWMPDAPVPLALASDTLVLLVGPDAAADAMPSLFGAALVVLWAAGAAVLLAWHAVAYLRFARRVAASGVTLGRVGRIALVVSDAVADPLAYGLVRPVVAVPRDFRGRYEPRERELALAHEVAHHQRGDMVANWAALAVLALHWFNPLAWIAFRAFRADQEMANDAHVLSRRAPGDRHAYGCAIVKAACGAAPAAACGLNTVTDLKGRLRMLANPINRRRRVAGTVVIAGATLALLGATASGGDAAETVRAEVERATGVPLDALAPTALLQAAPPAPPAAPAPAPAGRHRKVEVVRHDGARSVTVVEDGRTRRFEGAEADAWIAAHPLPVPPTPPAPPAAPAPGAAPMPPVPPAPPEAAEAALRDLPRVVSRSCGTAGGATSFTRVEGGRRLTVICTDRIAAAANHAQQAASRAQFAALDAGRMRLRALNGALAGLRRTRTTMATGRGFDHLTAEQRADALGGIDDSIATLERQLAERD